MRLDYTILNSPRSRDSGKPLISGWLLRKTYIKNDDRYTVGFSGERLKVILRNYPTGVTIVTTRVDDQYYGLTVNSFTSVSLEPPLVLIAIDRRIQSHDAIRRSGFFVVNILPYRLRELAVRFATAPREERFRGLTVRLSKLGAPIIDGAAAYLECKVINEFPGGDHTIFIGEVIDGDLLSDGPPLVYYNRGYYTIDGFR